MGMNVVILLGVGDGTFEPAVAFEGFSDLDSIATADFNGDGKLDLAVGTSGLSVLLNDTCDR